ncbi:hypothetical protein Desor_3190 [Desulfosporosinus orientis DSM 765]|uniref:Uncharacterized protein n=1 Tax=Desulfosporosinus orientis (strain ATCC 19365 / DSM 765 / NCIMB 8382 / VKM B-1628 / Singapore I) TaxID=768706 RepID=G7W953_DESOD|nr:hypothetical protein [Desulfosporosinus orientis]AET68694.1 hypothetical protein Desor_3190 [Desulfosporosinus orientis DSM 765]
MTECEELVNRFTLAGQDRGIRELCADELNEYHSIYNDLMSKHVESNGEILKDMEIQAINKIYASNDLNITPMGLVNVSLEYLARILTFAKAQGIEWHVCCDKCTDTHFKNLSHFTVKVNCHKDEFVTMAEAAGFRY